MIPEWLKETRPLAPSDIAATGSRCGKGSRAHRFLDGTLAAAARIGGQTALFSETADKKGLLQGLDPRVKVLSLLALIIGGSFSHSIYSLLFLCLLGPVLAFFSRIPAGAYLGRVWMVVPLFTAAVALPAALNIITPGRVIFILFPSPFSGSFGSRRIPETIAVTHEGVLAAITLVMRTGASVSMAMLAVMTTPWPDLLRALRGLGIPRPFVMVLTLAYRYIVVLITAVEEMCLARKSRSIEESCLTKQKDAGRGWIASRMGALFRKTGYLGAEVSRAMTSRGFIGEPRTLTTMRLRLADRLWLLGSMIIAALVAVDGIGFK